MHRLAVARHIGFKTIESKAASIPPKRFANMFIASGCGGRLHRKSGPMTVLRGSAAQRSILFSLPDTAYVF